MPKISRKNRARKPTKKQKPTKRRRARSIRRQARGGCGCNTTAEEVQLQSPLSSGSLEMRGGEGCTACNSQHQMSGGNPFDGLPKESYYPPSPDFRLDDTNVSSRLIGGGRRMKRGRKGKTNKRYKMSGGGDGYNAASSFGDLLPIPDMSKFINNSSTVNTNLNVQPVVDGPSELV